MAHNVTECPCYTEFPRRQEKNPQPRQRATIPILAGANSVAAAPRMSRVSRRTLHRWLKDEECRQKLSEQANKSGKFNQAQLLHEEIQALEDALPAWVAHFGKTGKK